MKKDKDLIFKVISATADIIISLATLITLLLSLKDP